MRRLLSFVALSAISLALPACAQQAPDTAQGITTLKTTARLVAIDVTVTDAKGNLVHGLTCPDFRLLDRKSPQKLRSCEDHTEPPPPLEAAPTLPPNVFSNAASPNLPETLDVFVFDFLSAGVYGPKMRLAARELLGTPIPGHRIAVFAIGDHLHLVSGFSDRIASSQDLQRKLTRAASGSLEAELPLVPGMDSDKSADKVVPLAMGAQRQLAAERNRHTVEQLRAIAAYVAPLPGRKRLLWVGGSKFTFGAQDTVESMYFDGEAFAMLLRLSREFADERVQVFPIDAGGVTVESTNFAARANMATTAQETGGKAFYGNNDLNDLFRKALDTGNEFYTLSYTPTEITSNGKFHEITISVPERKLRLSYRRGYLAPDADRERILAEAIARNPSPPREPTGIAKALTRGFPDATSLHFQVRIDPASPVTREPVAAFKKGKPTPMDRMYTLNFTVNTADIAWVSDGTMQTANLKTHMAIYDLENELAGGNDTPVKLRLTSGQYEMARTQGVHLHLTTHLSLIPGMHLRLAVEDLGNHHLGTVELDSGSLQPVPIQERATVTP